MPLKSWHIDVGALSIFVFGLYTIGIYGALLFVALTYGFGLYLLKQQRKEARNGDLPQD